MYYKGGIMPELAPVQDIQNVDYEEEPNVESAS